MVKNKILIFALISLFFLPVFAFGEAKQEAAAGQDLVVVEEQNNAEADAYTVALPVAAQPQESAKEQDTETVVLPVTAEARGSVGVQDTETVVLPAGEQPKAVLAKPASTNSQYIDPTKYTLGPDDVIEITVMRHPEFSGVYPINLEGKIQYKFVGDIEIKGLTKVQLEKKITEIISAYVINPEVNITILEYKSKVIYVLGEVGMPGKYYMRSETIPVREAVVSAGLPTLSAAMRRCLLITPDDKGHAKTRPVDLYSLLYGGDLTKNVDMKPGDVLYVPATVMAKVIRVINPVTSVIGVSTSGPSDINAGRNALNTMVK